MVRFDSCCSAGRGRKPKKLLEDHAEIASSSTDNDEPARAKESVKTENVDRPRERERILPVSRVLVSHPGGLC